MVIRVPISTISTRKLMPSSRNRRGKKEEDSWLSNELSNMMEISLLCYIKAHGTTPEYYISFFKAILDYSKDWEQWIAVNEGFSGRKEAKLNQLHDITFSWKKNLSFTAKIKNQPERMKEYRATGRLCNKISYNVDYNIKRSQRHWEQKAATIKKSNKRQLLGNFTFIVIYSN